MNESEAKAYEEFKEQLEQNMMGMISNVFLGGKARNIEPWEKEVVNYAKKFVPGIQSYHDLSILDAQLIELKGIGCVFSEEEDNIVVFDDPSGQIPWGSKYNKTDQGLEFDKFVAIYDHSGFKEKNDGSPVNYEDICRYARTEAIKDKLHGRLPAVINNHGEWYFLSEHSDVNGSSTVSATHMVVGPITALLRPIDADVINKMIEEGKLPTTINELLENEQEKDDNTKGPYTWYIQGEQQSDGPERS